VLQLTETATWNMRAACRGESASLFMPAIALQSAPGNARRVKHAKRVCAQCPVRRECLDYALRVDEQLGIWGGLDAAERRALRR
jgi:WhiB family redox-sensing transcriptional regulator